MTEERWGEVCVDDLDWAWLEVSVTIRCNCGKTVEIYDDEGMIPCSCGRVYRVLATVESKGHDVDGFHEAFPVDEADR